MNFKKSFLLVNLFLFFSFSFSQNYRDIIIQDSIIDNLIKENYKGVKIHVENLEKIYGYEPELKLIILEKSFKNNDLKYFKNELKLLVRDYGFNISYMNKSSSYYKAITSGDLSKWFKKIYLKNHLKWLKNNFLKQIDIEKLNNLGKRDQLLVNFASDLRSNFKDNNSCKNKIDSILKQYLFSEIMTLYEITNRIGAYPSAKSFALTQNQFAILEIHSLKNKDNLDEFWKLFFPFYKEAYLKNEIDYVIFKNYDNISYLNFGNQSFGLLNIEDVPEVLRKKNDTDVTIPIKDSIFMRKVRKDFNWKKYKE